MKIKKGDTVEVLTGKDKGARGEVVSVDAFAGESHGLVHTDIGQGCPQLGQVVAIDAFPGQLEGLLGSDTGHGGSELGQVIAVDTLSVESQDLLEIEVRQTDGYQLVQVVSIHASVGQVDQASGVRSKAMALEGCEGVGVESGLGQGVEGSVAEIGPTCAGCALA